MTPNQEITPEEILAEYQNTPMPETQDEGDSLIRIEEA